jgi:hypothetical protein
MDPAALAALARHGEALATARAFMESSGAQRVVLLLDLGADQSAMIDCDATRNAIEVIEGDTAVTLPATVAIPARPNPLPEIRATPPSAISMDVESGELAAPLGTIEHLAAIVLALARTFGGRSVATAEFPTRDPELPITLAARDGEPVVLGAADAQYELGT